MAWDDVFLLSTFSIFITALILALRVRISV